MSACKTCRHFHSTRIRSVPGYLQHDNRCIWGALQTRPPLWFHSTPERVRDPDAQHACRAWEIRKTDG